MGAKSRGGLFKWWHKHWDKQWWMVGLFILVLLIIIWGVWASSFGITVGVNRNADIKLLIQSKNDWVEANDNLSRIQKIILANPLSFPDPAADLAQAEDKAQEATKTFRDAGYKALAGEIIIITGVTLQVLLVLVIIGILRATSEKILEKRSIRTENLMEKWKNNINSGQVLAMEDDILKFIRGEKNENNLSYLATKRGDQVDKEYRRFLVKHKRSSEFEIPWFYLARLVYKLRILTRWAKEEIRNNLRDQHTELSKIIWGCIRNNLFSAVLSPLLFLLIFWGLSTVWNVYLVGEELGNQLTFWQLPVILFGAAFFVNGVMRVLGVAVVRWFTERTWSDIDDVVISAVIGPASAMLTAVLFLKAVDILTGPGTEPLEFGPFLAWVAHEAVATVPRTLVVIAVSTWFAVYLLNHVIVWVMEQWARRTEQIYDDMFVKFIQVFGTFIIVAFGGGACLAVYNTPLSEATGVDNIILPYTIIVSVFTAIIGYASSAGFENFFGGLMLQVEKPFERGERIVLPDGQICDVREIGMRCTVLYNVMENSEVSVPNSEMSKMTIKNTSRPDLELRISTPIWIDVGSANLKTAGAILLDIAYLEGEVDQMRALQSELTRDERDSKPNRSTIEEEMDRLVSRYEKIKKTVVSQIVGGGTSDALRVFKAPDDKSDRLDPYRVVLENISAYRHEYKQKLKKEDDWLAAGLNEAGIVRTKNINLMRNYRRALNEIAFNSEPDDVLMNNFVSNVAKYERIDVEGLIKVVNTLAECEPVDQPITSTNVSQLRKRLRDFETERLGLVLQISDEVATLETFIYAIAEQYSEIRPELDKLLSELNKEPAIASEYTEDGHVRIILNSYAHYLERRLEVQHKINRDIERRFHNAGIKFELRLEQIIPDRRR